MITPSSGAVQRAHRKAATIMSRSSSWCHLWRLGLDRWRMGKMVSSLLSEWNRCHQIDTLFCPLTHRYRLNVNGDDLSKTFEGTRSRRDPSCAQKLCRTLLIAQADFTRRIMKAVKLFRLPIHFSTKFCDGCALVFRALSVETLSFVRQHAHCLLWCFDSRP